MNIINNVFEWILEAGLRASLLVPIVLAAQWLLRKHLPASWRYALWLPVLVALLVPALPILPSSTAPWMSSREAAVDVGEAPSQVQSGQAFLPGGSETPLATEEASSASRSPSADGGTPGLAASPLSTGSTDSPVIAPTRPPAPIDWGAVALWAWLVGAGAVGLLILASFVMTMRRVKHAALPVHPDLLARVAHLASAAGLRCAPQVWRSSAVSSPAVCGLWRPVLLVNERFEEDLSEDERELILRHELAHIRRGDLLLNALQCGLLALHWFNPVLWLAFFRARADREAACDEAVLRGEPAPRRAAYGHTLLKMETEFAPSGLCLGFVGILQGRGTLRTRIQSIIAQRKLNALSAAVLATSIAVLGILGITGVDARSQVVEPQSGPDPDNKTAVGSPGGDDAFMERHGEDQYQKIADRQIPSKAVSGKLNGARFVPERVELEDGSLRFRTGEGFDLRGAFDMHGFDIQIPGGAKDLGNKAFISTLQKPLEGFEVDFFWPNRSTTPPSAKGKSLIFGNFSLKLEFGAVTDRKLPGKIYLHTEESKNHIEGAFEVSLD